MERPYRRIRKQLVMELLQELYNRHAEVVLLPPGSTADMLIKTSEKKKYRLRALLASSIQLDGSYLVDTSRQKRKGSEVERVPYVKAEVDFLITQAGKHWYIFPTEECLPQRTRVRPGAAYFMQYKGNRGEDRWDFIDPELCTEKEQKKIRSINAMERELRAEDMPIDFDAMMQEPWNEGPCPRVPFPEARPDL